MPGRDTGTGSVLEQMVLPALRRGGYEYQTQVAIGERLGGGKHVVDLVAWSDDSTKFLISLKWQQVSGTAEQKVPFEVMCLAEAVLVSDGKYDKAYLVLGGAGWSRREFFISDDLKRHLRHADLVSVTTLEFFVALANVSKL